MQKIRTEKLCYEYCSAAPFEAEILEIHPTQSGSAIILDKTIFYPEGGGQPSDRGSINGVQLLDVIEKEGDILHLATAEDAQKLKPGKAELILDVRRRRDHAQLHTGQHLLSAAILRMTGAPTVSMHMGDETCTIDIGISELHEETILAIEDAVSDAIEENQPVITHLCPPEDIMSLPLRKQPPKGEEVIRVVEIKKHDIIACCGTHLRSTAEIGLFRILNAEKYKGMTRVTFISGHRLLLNSRLLRQNAEIASHALSVPINETGKGVLELAEKLAQTEKRLKVFIEMAVKEKAEFLIRKITHDSKQALFVERYNNEDINEILNIGKIVQKQAKTAFVLASITDMKFAAFSSKDNIDLRSLLKTSLEKAGGKGGGSPSFFQGGFQSQEAFDGFLLEIQSS